MCLLVMYILFIQSDITDCFVVMQLTQSYRHSKSEHLQMADIHMIHLQYELVKRENEKSVINIQRVCMKQKKTE